MIADLVGGPADGRRLEIRDEDEFGTLNVVDLDESPLNPAGPQKTTYTTLIYRRTGIRDDGRRIFSYVGFQ